MPQFTRIILTLIALLIAAPVSVMAKRPAMGTVIVDGANVRSNPSVKSSVIATLKKKGFVLVSGVRGQWAKVMFLPQGKNKFKAGWVLAKFIRVVSGGKSSSYSNGYGANFSLNIDSTDMIVV